jgi:hypothetical protein
VAFKQTITGKGAKKQTKTSFELITAWNDCWLNSLCVPIMEVWRANMDFRLTLDFGKVIGYMTKYVSKQESTSKAGTQRMIRNIVNKAMDDGKPVHHALQKTMSKLNGERMMSRQETAHLMQSLPLVCCSHSFTTINMKTMSTKLTKPTKEGEAASLKLISELYGERMEAESWPNESEMRAFQDNHSCLETMSFHKFGGLLRVCQSGNYRNKLRPHSKITTVVKFVPKLSCNPESKSYPDYCRYALIKYRPWQGPISNAWGEKDSSECEIVAEWQTFLQALATNGEQPPDFLDCEMNTYLAMQKYKSNTANASNMLINPGADGAGEELEEEARDDWMHGADGDHFAQNDDAINDAATDIKWDRDHNWQAPQKAYDDNHAPADVNSTYASMLKSENTFIRKIVRPNQLNQKQRQAHDWIKELVRAPAGTSKTDSDTGIFGRCFLLRGQGGTGKSFTIDAIVNSVSDEYGGDSVGIMATTGKAATVIGGSTVHSHKLGLALPIGKSV